MSTTCRAALWLLCAAALAFGQPTFTQCDITRDHALKVDDVQAIVLEDSIAGTTDDLDADGKVTVTDIQIVINGVMGIGCPRDLVTPTFALTSVTLLNRAWIPADIPSPGDLTIHGTVANAATVLNQYWIPADIPSPGNLTVNSAYSAAASVLNQAWIPADIPSPGNVTINGVYSAAASVLNQAWIPADIPSPGNVKFAAGLMVTMNNTAAPGPLSLHPNFGVKVVAGGSSTTPVDLSSVHDGDALLAGQTVRFRIFPPDGAAPNSDFLLNGAPLRLHGPFEVLVTAPAGVSGFDLQAVVYAADGQGWRTRQKHLLVLPDPGLTMTGHATRAPGSTAAAIRIGTRVNGLTAEYFDATQGLASWAGLNREPDKRGVVTAVNQPNPGAVFGVDPFGTGFTGPYAARFRGQILVSQEGLHQFFLDASLGARLTVDGQTLIDTPAGQFAPETQGEATLTAGWHDIEIDSYHTGSNPNLQLSWRQPNSGREVVRPEALAADLPVRAATDANGSFRLTSFPTILNPLDWYSVPADKQIRVVLDQSTSDERPIH